MGESGPHILKTITNSEISTHADKTMKEAIALAKDQKGTCLLSPASPSYDMYKSYEEKGGEFASLI